MMYLKCYSLGEKKKGSYAYICVGLYHPWQDEKLLTEIIALRLVRGENGL